MFVTSIRVIKGNFYFLKVISVYTLSQARERDWKRVKKKLTIQGRSVKQNLTNPISKLFWWINFEKSLLYQNILFKT